MTAPQLLLHSARSWLGERHAVLFWSCVGLVAAVAVAVTVPLLTTQPLGFDEGWNLQAPYELVTDGKYASFGAVFDGQTKVFDPYLSTGPAVSLPIAAVYAMFGIGVEQARLVMLAFYVVALVLLAAYAYGDSRSMCALLGPMVLLLVASSGVMFRVEVLGEIPAVVYGLASMLAWRRGTHWLAGVFAALAVLSKLVMSLLVVAGCVTLALLLVRRRNEWRTVTKQAVQWGLGVAVPLALWELFRFMQLGRSLAAYRRNLDEFVHVFGESSSGVRGIGTAGLTIEAKLEAILSNVSTPRPLLGIAAIAIVAGLAIGRDKLRAALSANLYGAAFGGTYVLWWVGVSSGGYTRYTVPLTVIGWAVLLHALLFVQPAGPGNARSMGTAPKFGLLVAVVVALIAVYAPYRPWKASPLTLSGQKYVAQHVREAHLTRLTHTGWWQNPEIQFLSGLHSQELRYVKSGESYELLLSPAPRDIVPAEYEQALLLCNQGVVFEDSGYVLCRGTK